MTTPANSKQFVAEVARQKEAALQHVKGNCRFLVVALVAAVVVGLVVWFGQQSADRDSTHFGLAFGLAGAVFCAGCILGRFVAPKSGAVCPQCGCDWNLESENNTQRWLAWRRCPGCGLDMGGEVDERKTEL
jgi:hypothetical protein